MVNEVVNINSGHNNIQSRAMLPRNLDEGMQYAKILSTSTMVPKDYAGNPGKIFVAIQMGMELGLFPLQALQNIAVINGRPSIWGDAALALCQKHPKWKGCKEHVEKDSNGNPIKGICEVKRKGEDPHTVEFSMKHAEKAGLVSRSNVWKQYPARMLVMRARGFALRDKFSDALKGLILYEEALDYPQDDLKDNQVEKPKQFSSSFEGEILPENPEKLEKLEGLLKISNTPQTTVDKWLNAAHVNSLSELDENRMDACIVRLENNLGKSVRKDKLDKILDQHAD